MHNINIISISNLIIVCTTHTNTCLFFITRIFYHYNIFKYNTKLVFLVSLTYLSYGLCLSENIISTHLSYVCVPAS